MILKKADLIVGVMVIFCFGYVQNKRKIKSVFDPNSEVNLDSLQLIAKYGDTPQRHSVVTEDGYVINMFRIPKKGPAVLMVHGIGDSSDSWLVTSPTASLAYQLSSLGFDIWLYNARGNKYSRDHVKNLSKKQYWNFSYEEMGLYDMPAVVDYILTTTNQKKLYYVGFSQGTTIFLIMCSLRPDFNEKIQQAYLLGPVAWLANTKYPFMDFYAKNSDVIKSFLDNIGVYDLFQNNELLKWFHASVCQDGVPQKFFCELEYAISYGVNNFTNLNVDRLPVISSHVPSGVSTRTFVHFFQQYLSKTFQRFDHGLKQNMIRYSSPKPPNFDVTFITAPINLFVSDSDWFSTVEDVKLLRKFLPNIISYVEFNKSLDFTHLEFVYGERSKKLVNDPLVNLILGNLYSNR